jgi:hypothetical protein
MFGTLHPSEIEGLLHSQVIGRIGCHSNGITYIIPVSYAYEENQIYCLGSNGQKIAMMRNNPKVCFQVDDTKNMGNWQSVVAWGEYEELNEPATRLAALEKLNKRKLPEIKSATMKLSDHWPFVPDNLGDIKGVVFRINLSEKTGRFEKADSGSYFAT